MTTQDRRKPYRVTYQYPGQEPGRAPHIRLRDAEELAARIARNGGEAQVLYVLEGADKVVARFGPDQLHRWTLADPSRPDSPLLCTCGRAATTGPHGDASAHVEAAGLCRACEGTTLVAERATGDDGKPMAGKLIDCPVCQGTGQAVDVSYWGVDTGSFYDRQAMLLLSAGFSVNT